MKNILPKILAKITGQKRDKVSILWNEQIITPNLFRLWEIVFWRRHGIKCEHAVDFWTDEYGVVHEKYYLYSWESKIAYSERFVRAYAYDTVKSVKNTLKYWDWKMSRLIPQFGAVFGAFQPQFAFEGAYTIPAEGQRPTGYVFAIAYDSLPQDQLGSATPTVDIGSSSNRILLCSTQGANGSDSVSAVTWNTTETMTKQASQQTGSNRFQTIWSLTPVGTGSHGAVIVGTLDIETFIVYSGVAQTGQPHNATTASGTSATSSISITTAGSTDWIFASLNNSASGQTPDGNTTKRSGGSNSTNAANDSNGTASPTSLGYTFTSSAWGAVGVSFSPFVAVVSTGNTMLMMGV